MDVATLICACWAGRRRGARSGGCDRPGLSGAGCRKTALGRAPWTSNELTLVAGNCRTAFPPERSLCAHRDRSVGRFDGRNAVEANA